MAHSEAVGAKMEREPRSERQKGDERGVSPAGMPPRRRVGHPKRCGKGDGNPRLPPEHAEREPGKNERKAALDEAKQAHRKAENEHGIRDHAGGGEEVVNRIRACSQRSQRE